MPSNHRERHDRDFNTITSIPLISSKNETLTLCLSICPKFYHRNDMLFLQDINMFLMRARVSYRLLLLGISLLVCTRTTLISLRRGLTYVRARGAISATWSSSHQKTTVCLSVKSNFTYTSANVYKRHTKRFPLPSLIRRNPHFLLMTHRPEQIAHVSTLSMLGFSFSN